MRRFHSFPIGVSVLKLQVRALPVSLDNKMKFYIGDTVYLKDNGPGYLGTVVKSSHPDFCNNEFVCVQWKDSFLGPLHYEISRNIIFLVERGNHGDFLEKMQERLG